MGNLQIDLASFVGDYSDEELQQIPKEELQAMIASVAVSLLDSIDDEACPLWVVDENLAAMRYLLELYRVEYPDG